MENGFINIGEVIKCKRQERNMKQALEWGADSFVVKPFQEECLIERIG